MSAQTEQLNAIGNDLANLSTSGYQAERVAFSDLLYNPVDQAGTVTTIGAGASAKLLGRSEAQGAIKTTGNPLDVAIEGAGYLRFTLPDGKSGLTRNGALSVGSGGMICDAEGNPLDPPIKVPAGVSEGALKIATDGTVSAGAHTLGRIELVSVAAPQQLLATGSGMLSASAQSGEPQPSTAKLQQGALEESNVDLGREMTQMVATERAYQMNSSAIQTESQMMSIANQLRT
jgi:flagellar basal-body rod protein FlgG